MYSRPSLLQMYICLDEVYTHKILQMYFVAHKMAEILGFLKLWFSQ